jgi:hypothetical protein
MLLRLDLNRIFTKMSTLAKCAHCHQFNVEAKNENDEYCSRCRNAKERGLIELPDRKASHIKTEKTDEKGSDKDPTKGEN